MKEEIHTWLDKVEREAIVPAEVIALNFGLYETEKGILHISGRCS